MASESSAEFRFHSAEDLLALLRSQQPPPTASKVDGDVGSRPEKERRQQQQVGLSTQSSVHRQSSRSSRQKDEGEDATLSFFMELCKPQHATPSDDDALPTPQQSLDDSLVTQTEDSILDQPRVPSITSAKKSSEIVSRETEVKRCAKQGLNERKSNQKKAKDVGTGTASSSIVESQASAPSQFENLEPSQTLVESSGRALLHAFIADKKSDSGDNEPATEEADEDMEAFWSEGVPAAASIWEQQAQKKSRGRSKVNTSQPSAKSAKSAEEAETSQSPGMAVGSESKGTEKKRGVSKRIKVVDETAVASENKEIAEAEDDLDLDAGDFRPQFNDDNVAMDRNQDVLLEPFHLSEYIYVHPYANRYLREYQRTGIKFMYRNVTNGESGAILNDDMGLGKTVQVVCLLLAILGKRGTPDDKLRVRDRRRTRAECLGQDGQDVASQNGPLGTVLIVGPKSVMRQWSRELDTWGYFDWVDLAQIDTETKRHDMIKRCNPATRGGIPVNPEVLLLPYSILPKYSPLLSQISFRLIVFDEVHMLKNPESLQTKAARALRAGARIGLTGTLMQNTFREFWVVMTTVCPKSLPRSYAVFDEYYAKPIKLARTKTASADVLKRGQGRAREIRAKVLDKFLLRRTKKLLAEQLPKKKENVIFCKMTPLQQRVYERIAHGRDAVLLRYAKDPCPCGRRGMKRGQCCFKSDMEAPLWRQFHKDYDTCQRCPYCLQLPMLSKLINCCNHLDLLKPDPTMESAQEVEYKRTFAREAFGNDVDQIGGLDRTNAFEVVSSPELSGKLHVLGQLLEIWRLQPSSRVLVFSHYTRILDIIGKFMDRQGMRHCRLDGSTSASQRQELLDKFNDLNDPDNFVFLISTKAGGLGLNLTAANIVVLFDSSWNPAYDVQAQDRAYRLGQRRDVDVYRLIATGTIEDKTYCRQLYKLQLSSEALEGNKEERYFEGVQGDAMRQGELFGVHNLVDYNPEGHLAELKRKYQWKNPLGETEQIKKAASASARAVLQAASRKECNFSVEQVGDVEESEPQQVDSVYEENEDELFALAYGKDSNAVADGPEEIEMAKHLLAANGLAASAVSGKKKKKKHVDSEEGHVHSQPRGDFIDMVTRMAENGGTRDGEAHDDDELITEDEYDPIESFSDDDDDEEQAEEEFIALNQKAKMSEILTKNAHMLIDSKDLVKGD